MEYLLTTGDSRGQYAREKYETLGAYGLSCILWENPQDKSERTILSFSEEDSKDVNRLLSIAKSFSADYRWRTVIEISAKEAPEDLLGEPLRSEGGYSVFQARENREWYREYPSTTLIVTFENSESLVFCTAEHYYHPESMQERLLDWLFTGETSRGGSYKGWQKLVKKVKGFIERYLLRKLLPVEALTRMAEL